MYNTLCMNLHDIYEHTFANDTLKSATYLTTPNEKGERNTSVILALWIFLGIAKFLTLEKYVTANSCSTSKSCDPTSVTPQLRLSRGFEQLELSQLSDSSWPRNDDQFHHLSSVVLLVPLNQLLSGSLWGIAMECFEGAHVKTCEGMFPVGLGIKSEDKKLNMTTYDNQATTLSDMFRFSAETLCKNCVAAASQKLFETASCCHLVQHHTSPNVVRGVVGVLCIDCLDLSFQA